MAGHIYIVAVPFNPKRNQNVKVIPPVLHCASLLHIILRLISARALENMYFPSEVSREHSSLCTNPFM